MASEDYTDTLIDHFEHPRNAGELEDADGVGTATSGACGDVLRIWIRVENEHIADIAFKCRGCPAAIACASMTTQLAKGRGLDEADLIADDTIADALGGLPPDKRHCSNLGAEALANAVMDYVVRSVEAELPARGRPQVI
jgi:nitrogen fixation NifU-like protein